MQELGKVINAHLQIGGNLKKALEYIASHVEEKQHTQWDKEIEDFKKGNLKKKKQKALHLKYNRQP